MKPRYLQIFLGYKIGLLIGERFREGGLKALYNLEKWKTSVFECSARRPNLERRLEVTL